VILSPEQYKEASTYDLLKAAADGHIGLDHRFLRAIIDRGSAAIPDLLRFAEEDRSTDLVDLEEELIAFFRTLRAPEAIPYLVDLIRRQPEDIPDDVIQAFVEIGELAVEPLLALHDEIDAEDNDLPFLLASLRVRHPGILAILLDRLDYDLMDAAFCLELYGDPAARPALEKAMAVLSDGDLDVRRSIEEALERIGKPPDADPMVEPYDIWSAYPEEDSPQFDLFSEQEKLEFLNSPEPGYRSGAATSFGKDDLSENVASRLIQLAESDPDARVRADSWEALSSYSTERPELRAKMLERLSDPGAPILERQGALVALAADADNPPIHNWLVEFYQRPETRAKALEAMWRSFDSRYAEYFPKHLDDPDVDVRREAIWGVGHLRIQSEAARLREHFHDEELRSDALFNYAVAWPGEVSRARARALLRRIEESAGGLSMVETQIVQTGIDQRLAVEGYRPAFSITEEEQDEDMEQEAVAVGKVGRNDPCPCGSGKKYKKCCGQ
jgi:HEAT repeat protein